MTSPTPAEIAAGLSEAPTMRRANKMCASCPFRGAGQDYRRESAMIPADAWPCHTEDLYGDAGIQCRGHFEARRKYPVSAEASAAYMEAGLREAEMELATLAVRAQLLGEG